MNIMKIRAVKNNDFDQLIDLLSEVGWFEDYLSNSRELLEIKFKKHIELSLADDSHSLFVAENMNDKIIGYANVHWLPYLFLRGCEGYISELFIRENFRGMGVGKKLLNLIEEEAAIRECSRLSLLNGKNRESNIRKFYQKQGFIEREQLSNFIKEL